MERGLIRARNRIDGIGRDVRAVWAKVRVDEEEPNDSHEAPDFEGCIFQKGFWQKASEIQGHGTECLVTAGESDGS